MTKKKTFQNNLMIKYKLVFTILLVCGVLINSYGQKPRKKIKPVYYGKVLGGFFQDKIIPNGFSGYNYLNLGIRKERGNKIKEVGIESYYFQLDHDYLYINEYAIFGYKQTSFLINSYLYLSFKQWNFSKFNLEIGPQFSLGYYHNSKLPYTSPNFEELYNDFKLGAALRLELSYPITQRFSLFLGSNYTIFQFGIRRHKINNPTLAQRLQLSDYVHVDLFLKRHISYIGILTQFGKIKKDRAKIRAKNAKARQKKKKKIAKKRLKKKREIEKKRFKKKDKLKVYKNHL